WGERVDGGAARGRAGRWTPQLRVEPCGPVAADDRHGLSPPQAERLETKADMADVRRVLLPRDFLPDAVLLLPQRDLAVPVAPRVGGEQLWQRHATSTSSPRYALTTLASRRTCAGVPSAIFLPKSKTAMRSEMSMTTPMSCSIITTVRRFTR